MNTFRIFGNCWVGAGLTAASLLFVPASHAQEEHEPPQPPRLSVVPPPEPDLEDGSRERGAWRVPAHIQVLRDVAYGSDPMQRMDVYRPARTTGKAAPVLLLVHGGAWRYGDKAAASVVENKVSYWVNQGWVVVSINHRLLPQAGPLMQLQDLILALTTAQSQAENWGGHADQFVLMGHSAGAHLVALLSAAPEQALRLGAKSWLGAVLLDSAALDVPGLMRQRHLRLYDSAFGDDPAYWRINSPLHQLETEGPPMLAVCSTRRITSCLQADQFANQARRQSRQVSVLRLDASHRDINQTLGLAGDYTSRVDAFLRSLRAAAR